MYQHIPVCASIYHHVLHHNSYLFLFIRLRSSIRLLLQPRRDLICTAYHMLQILVKRCRKFSSRAWNGIWQLVSREFQSQRCLPCSRRLSTCLTSSRKICQIRLEKRPNGISRRHTVFYTRSGRLCCGVTPTTWTAHVNLQRYVPVHTSTYQYKLVHTGMC